MRTETEYEQLKYKMNNDVSYINHLHEYNYLKVSEKTRRKTEIYIIAL